MKINPLKWKKVLIKRLEQSKVPGNMEREVHWMMEALGVNALRKPCTDVPLSKLKKLVGWIEDRGRRRKPLQYILGNVPFAGMELLVRPPILIPRPETEQWCIELSEKILSVADAIDEPLTILDIGTGSGCISLALAHLLQEKVHCFGIDSNESALELAEINKIKCGLDNVSFAYLSLEKSTAEQLMTAFGRSSFDVIVSNPPYIPVHHWSQLQDDVRLWEDPAALIAGENGLSVIHSVIHASKELLSKRKGSNRYPRIVVEFGDDFQVPAIHRAFRQIGLGSETWVDLFGRQRCVFAYSKQD